MADWLRKAGYWTALAIAAGAVPPHARAAGETVAQAVSAFDTDIRNYNLMTLGGGATLTGFTDTQGPLAIGGNLTLKGGQIATSPTLYAASSDPTLYVTGTLKLTGATELMNGYASLPGETTSDYTWSSTTRDLVSASKPANELESDATTGTHATTSPLTNPAPSGFSLTSVTTDMTNASTALGNATTTGTIVVSAGAMEFNPNSTPAAGSVVIFSLDASAFNSTGNKYNSASVTSVQINVPADVDYVINVVNASNSKIFGTAVTMTQGTNDNQLLWNIEGSSTVTLGGTDFYGAVLAPSATVKNASGTTLTGQIVADAFSDTSAPLDFQGFTAVVVPEPATYGLWAIGLCAGAAVTASGRPKLWRAARVRLARLRRG